RIVQSRAIFSDRIRLVKAGASGNHRMTETGEKFDRINAIPAYQLVADAIEREILARRIRPGEPIGTEAQLVKPFGANRSTGRQGIRLLEQSGLSHPGS